MQEREAAYAHHSDDELLKQAKKDKKAFGVLYSKYWERIYVFIYQRLGEKEDAKDVCQQVFVKAMLNLNKYESRGYAFSSWLYRIAISEASNYVSKGNKIRTVHAESTELQQLFEDLGEERQAFRKNALVKALNELNENDLQLVEMRYFEKFKLKDVAEILGITEGNCKVRMHRVMKKLGEQVKAKIAENESQV